MLPRKFFALKMLIFMTPELQIRGNGSPGLLQATIIANPNTNPMKRYRFIAAKIMKKRH